MAGYQYRKNNKPTPAPANSSKPGVPKNRVRGVLVHEIGHATGTPQAEPGSGLDQDYISVAQHRSILAKHKEQAEAAEKVYRSRIAALVRDLYEAGQKYNRLVERHAELRVKTEQTPRGAVLREEAKALQEQLGRKNRLIEKLEAQAIVVLEESPGAEDPLAPMPEDWPLVDRLRLLERARVTIETQIYLTASTIHPGRPGAGAAA